MVEAGVVARWVSALLCLASLGMLISSFIFSILARNQLSTFKDSYESIISTWGQDMVFDLSLSANPALAATSSDYVVSPWASNWPGNVAGCYCPHGDAALEVSQGLSTGNCNSNQTQAGCSDIASRGPQLMSKWTSTDTIYAVRGKGTSFLQNYRRMNSAGTCQSGYKRCGNINSKSKGICIPESFVNCPLTDIRTSTAVGYSLLTLSNGAQIYHGRTDQSNSISELLIVQSHVCFIRSRLGYTAGRAIC
jgi:hypothetical protein